MYMSFVHLFVLFSVALLLVNGIQIKKQMCSNRRWKKKMRASKLFLCWCLFLLHCFLDELR
jgi:uncharacterized membrane protein